jgi:hypothetical protein
MKGSNIEKIVKGMNVATENVSILGCTGQKYFVYIIFIPVLKQFMELTHG